MAERPIGDEVDQLLRRSVSNLAELAGPAPELEAMQASVQLDEYAAERARRWPVVALGAVAAALVLVAFVAFGGRNEALDQEVVDERRELVASDWAAYVASVDAEVVQRCLGRWIVNRDLHFGITGDQFAASSDVARFEVAYASAEAWTGRHRPGIGALETLGDELALGGLPAAFDSLAADLATSPAPETIDVAPVLNVGGSTAVAPIDPCPLGAAEDGSPLHDALVAYAGDGARLLPAIRCADAAMVELLSDSPASIAFAEMVARGPLVERDGAIREAVAAVVAGEPDGVAAARSAAASWLRVNRDCPLAR